MRLLLTTIGAAVAALSVHAAPPSPAQMEQRTDCAVVILAGKPEGFKALAYGLKGPACSKEIQKEAGRLMLGALRSCGVSAEDSGVDATLAAGQITMAKLKRYSYEFAQIVQQADAAKGQCP